MARVELMPGIQSISGRLGDMVFRTYKKTGKVTVTLMPREKRGAKDPRTEQRELGGVSPSTRQRKEK